MPDLAAWVARLSLRVRMMMLVTVAALPALALFAYTEFGPHRIGGRDEAAVLVGALLVIGGALVSLGFGLALGEHFLRRPADALLSAAGAWSAGNLDARIDVSETSGAEFCRIAQTFNAMAEALGCQRTQLRELNAELERRVAARTRELTDSHNRLMAEVAERDRAETALRQVQKIQSVGQLAGGIAQEFNNLLTTIVGALDLLRGRLSSNQDGLVRLVDGALVAADRGSRLTEQLLTFSRRQRLSPVPTDMNATISALMDLLGSTLGRSVRLQAELADGVWPAMVDPSQVEAAILNLAINARDAMPEGGALRFTTANVTLPAGGVLAAGDYVAVQVVDTGIGMDENVAAMAVEPFFTTKGDGGGAGLGLSQVHGLAVQSGGEVRIKSVPGIGTTVTLLLPRAPGESCRAPSPPPGAQAPGPGLGRGRGRVLVVDDDAGVREIILAMLESCGFTAEIADGGEAALALLASGARFDLLLTDFVMPGMSGIALIEAVSEAYPSMRSMLMTGATEVAEAAPVGSERLLRKPFNVAVLEERVSRVLAGPRLLVIDGGAAAE